jgi:hypothetical protein
MSTIAYFYESQCSKTNGSLPEIALEALGAPQQFKASGGLGEGRRAPEGCQGAKKPVGRTSVTGSVTGGGEAQFGQFYLRIEALEAKFWKATITGGTGWTARGVELRSQMPE